MHFLRTVQLDASDLQVFEQAAEPGEWAVPGSFALLEIDPQTRFALPLLHAQRLTTLNQRI